MTKEELALLSNYIHETSMKKLFEQAKAKAKDREDLYGTGPLPLSFGCLPAGEPLYYTGYGTCDPAPKSAQKKEETMRYNDCVAAATNLSINVPEQKEQWYT